MRDEPFPLSFETLPSADGAACTESAVIKVTKNTSEYVHDFLDERRVRSLPMGGQRKYSTCSSKEISPPDGTTSPHPREEEEEGAKACALIALILNSIGQS